MAQRTAITFRASPEVLAAIDAKANADFCKRGEAVAAIMESAVAKSTGTAPSSSPMADIKERSATADLTLKEIKLAQVRKELLTVDSACNVVEKTFAEMRTEGLTLMDDFASDYGLNAEDLRRRFLAVMAGPLTVAREPFDELAKDFAREALPT